MMNVKSYTELIKLNTFEERYAYLKLDGSIGKETFGFDRFINQAFYRSVEWKKVRDLVILRDNGCDLGMEGYTVYGKVIIHHMNPICIEAILSHSEILLDPEYLITTTHATHNAIHYGKDHTMLFSKEERRKNDTCPWK